MMNDEMIVDDMDGMDNSGSERPGDQIPDLIVAASETEQPLGVWLAL